MYECPDDPAPARVRSSRAMPEPARQYASKSPKCLERLNTHPNRIQARRFLASRWELDKPFGEPRGCFIALQGDPMSALRSEEHTSELQSLMRISYAVFCLKKKKTNQTQ